MADVLVFEVNEFEVLESFDFEEEVQRPEDTRFYTLDEQLIDFFDKMMPKRKITKFEIKELKHLRDRIKEAYQNLVVVTETDYIIDRSRKAVNTSWIHPVYSGFDFKEYSYKKEWLPLFTDQRRNVNYYPRLLKALPSPYTSTVDGRMLDKSAMLLNEEGENPINGLGNYLMTKTIVNDDGTVDVETIEAPNTADNLKTIGFYLDARSLDIPRPMMEHPFLKSNKASFVKTDVSLLDSYPSISAIMEHAIPVTTDPYIEGRRYLKLYDIKLSQIPWSSWKERFPSVERIDIAHPISELKFKGGNEDKPGDILTKTYLVPWYQGYDSRYWLSSQIDGGALVSRILLSESNNTGNLAAYPFSDVSESHPETKPEICMNLSENFNIFLDSGLYRKIKGKGVCIPVSTILQEKSALFYKDRIIWKESTKHDILASYQKLLKVFQLPSMPEEIQKYDKIDHHSPSERRKDILSIMEDNQREPEDKADDIERIVRDLNLDSNKYYDLADQFVVCLHSLELLRGALDNRFNFYAKWTVTVDGMRVCKHCGEQVNKDTFVAVKEYDEDGHLTMDYEVLNENKAAVVTSALDIKKLFKFENTGESLLFTILTILQVTPDELQLMPILQLIRKLTSALRGKAAATRMISAESQELTESVLGISGAVVLLQTHSPFLIPRRGIGSKPLNMSGFPRDSDNPEDSPILNSIFSILRKTLESVPASFKGGIATGLRAILKNSKELHTESLRWMKIFSDQFKPLFESARERYQVPDEDVPMNTIQLPIQLVEKPVYVPGDMNIEEQYTKCITPKTTAVWYTKLPPNVRQSELKLRDKIQASPNYSLVVSSSSSLSFNTISDKDIRRRVGLGLPTGFPALAEFIKTADSASYVTIISRFLSILSGTSFSVKEQTRFRDLVIRLDIRESSSLLRDTAKGIFFELMAAIKASAPLSRLILDSLKTDLTLRMILLSEAAATKEDFELRSKERNFLKAALRALNDTEREVTQRMLELGIADVIISNVDRERFAREFSWVDEEPIEDLNLVDANRPEEGYAGDRDYVENGDQPLANDGTALEVDRGFYGDRGVRDYEDYTAQTGFDNDDTL